jgi:exodeoxyribonuclease V alpha subunit
MPLGRDRDDLKYSRLTQLTGIGPRLADKIRFEFAEGMELDEAELYALTRVQEDPYRLTNIEGIAFKKADKIALNDYDVDPDAPIRHKHGNRAALEQYGCLLLKEYLWERRKLGLLSEHLQFEGIDLDSGRVWLPEELAAEWIVARYIARKLPPASTTPVPLAVLSAAQGVVMDQAELDQDQRQVIAQALFRGGLLVLTGAAGTGKTWTLGALGRCALLEQKTMHVAAFSGKAADRAAEVLGSVAECSTIHRMLGLGLDRPDRFGALPIDADIVVLDEASMIPTWLLAHVIAALRPETTLILTGDPAQLPPIGYGFPFIDIIDAGAARVHLTQNYRQAGQVSIFDLAEGIRRRERWPTINEDAPGLFLYTDLSDDDLDQYSQEAVRYAQQLPLQDWQCLTWKNETREMLNLELQAMFNPHGRELMRYPCWKLGRDSRGAPLEHAEIRVGDKVVVQKNDYLAQIYNGQTGVAIGTPDVDELYAESKALERQLKNALANSTGESDPQVVGLKKRLDRTNEIILRPGVLIKIKDREIPMSVGMAEKLLCLGYCLTVHKAQGSGWPLVIIFQPDAVDSRALPNRLYYTAVTRAETDLFVFTQLGMRRFWANVTEREKLPESTLQKRIQACLNLAEAAAA